MRNPKQAGVGFAVLLALGLVAAACGSDSGSNGGTSGGNGLSGDVNVSGSSTVQPISSLVAEDFSKDNSGVSIKVDGPGTGDGNLAQSQLQQIPEYCLVRVIDPTIQPGVAYNYQIQIRMMTRNVKYAAQTAMA